MAMTIRSIFSSHLGLGIIVVGVGLLVSLGIGRLNVQADDTMAEIVVILTKEAMRTGKDDAIAMIEPHVADRGYDLAAVHPDVEDDELARYFHVFMPDIVDAEALAEELLGLPGVDAAYAKPSATLP